MEKQKELQKLQQEYDTLVSRYNELEERLNNDNSLEDEARDLLEDQYCALRCYLNALLYSMEYIDSLIEDEKRKEKKTAKKGKGKEERTINITEGIRLSDEDGNEILKSLCTHIDRMNGLRLL